MPFPFPISRITLLLLFFSTAQTNTNPTSSCPSSSCGNIRNIIFPFRLKGEPRSCGFQNPSFELDCNNNQTLLFNLKPKTYQVLEINYTNFSIRLIDQGINGKNLSSCPVYSNSYDDWPSTIFNMLFDLNFPVMFIHCLAPVNSLQYVNASFCGNSSGFFSDSSKGYNYVLVGDRVVLSDLEDSCTGYGANWASVRNPVRDDNSLSGIYDSLGYGFEVSWFRVLCGECERSHGFCSLEGNKVICEHYCSESVPISELHFGCQLEYWGLIVGFYSGIIIGGIAALRFLFGFPLLVALVVYKWRRRHLSTDATIEDFLQAQNNFTPIKYTYSEIKKMTNNFGQKLGEGGFGTVYKGKLTSGPYVAIKMMGQSVTSEEEFMSEVGTIGRIHHVNIVQLIGFCFGIRISTKWFSR